MLSRTWAARATTVIVATVASLFVVLWSGECAAFSKDECIDAHGRGQDLRDKGQLVRAKQLFLTCAQPMCPGLVQSDCARFSEELSRIVPTVSFAARDAAAADLPMTTVYVDEVLFTSRLDDGKSYELDPGKHVIRYVHDGKDTTVRVVVNQGEKGRSLLATFAGDGVPPAADASTAPPAPHKSVLPLVVAGIGGAALVSGGVMLFAGLHKVPANCSVSTKECAAPSDDPSLTDASHGVSLANTGVAVGIAGAAVLVGGIVWYFVQPTPGASETASSRPRRLVTPWVAQSSAGLGMVGTF